MTCIILCSRTERGSHCEGPLRRLCFYGHQATAAPRWWDNHSHLQYLPSGRGSSPLLHMEEVPQWRIQGAQGSPIYVHSLIACSEVCPLGLIVSKHDPVVEPGALTLAELHHAGHEAIRTPVRRLGYGNRLIRVLLLQPGVPSIQFPLAPYLRALIARPGAQLALLRPGGEILTGYLVRHFSDVPLCSDLSVKRHPVQ